MAHRCSSTWATARLYNRDVVDRPRHLDLHGDRGLRVEWADGTTSFYPVAYLRRMSPSAEARHLRQEMARNPLTVLPAGPPGPLRAESAELVGHYALRIRFSDGHDTGIYSWSYLRAIDPAAEPHQDPQA
jgi:DUF971 family protein